MRVKVVLHSVLREKLPAKNKGRIELELPDGCTVAEVFKSLDLPEHVAWALNNSLQRDRQIVLQAGDEVRVFRQGAGG